MKYAIIAIGLLCGVPFAARAADDDQLTKLQPPHGELQPTFWEQRGWLVIVAAVGAVALLVLLVIVLRRPKPAVVIPPDVLARRALEALRGGPEDGELLMKASGILRRYVTFACGLPAGELTTAEICQAVGANRRFGHVLGGAVADFFRQCDTRKFSPPPQAPDTGVVAAALELVERIELRRREAASAAPPPLPQSAAAPSP